MSYSNGPKMVTDGLVMYLDAGSEKSYGGSGTVWNDLSANNNSGSLINGITYNSSNKGYLAFDGTNDYINSTNCLDNPSELTTAAWIKTNSYGSGYSIIIGKIKYLAGNSDTAGWYMAVGSNVGGSANSLCFGSQRAGDGLGTFSIAKDTNLASEGTWKYVTATLTGGTGGTITLYVNGISYPLTTYFDVSGFSSSNPYNITIGSNSSFVADTYNLFYNGGISMVKAYNRCLSANEILQNYNSTKGRYNL